MAQFVDRPLPASLELPRLQHPRPRHRGTENLRNGPGTGRVKGVQNKICRDLKEGLLESAILHGYDGDGQDGLIGFCLHLAERHPKIHGGLLAKLLPYNLNANVAGPRINSVNVMSVPVGVHLTREQMDAVRQGQPLTLDHEQQMAETPAIPEIAPPQDVESSSADDGRQLLDAIQALSKQVERLT
jgi:hypothetical protein